jgi:hypothetical protein
MLHRRLCLLHRMLGLLRRVLHHTLRMLHRAHLLLFRIRLPQRMCSCLQVLCSHQFSLWPSPLLCHCSPRICASNRPSSLNCCYTGHSTTCSTVCTCSVTSCLMAVLHTIKCAWLKILHTKTWHRLFHAWVPTGRFAADHLLMLQDMHYRLRNTELLM